MDKENRGIQTIMLLENPIKPEHLDSLFQTALKLIGISAPTAVVYFHNIPGNQPVHSVQDTTFYIYSFATEEIETAIDGSILLRGYIKLSWLDYIRYHSEFYSFWMGSGILIIALICYYRSVRRKKNTSSEIIPAPTMPELPTEPELPAESERPVKEQPTVVTYQPYSRTVTYGDMVVSLTPK